MTVLPVGYAEASCKFTIPGDAGPAYVVFGLDPDVVTDPGQIAEDVADTWNVSGGPLQYMSADATLSEVRVVVGVDGSSDTFGLWTGAFAGGVSGAGSPGSVCFLWRKNTGLVGADQRGRMYLPGVPETHVNSDGLLPAAQLNDQVTSAEVFRSTLETDLLNMVLLHSDPLTLPTPIVAINPDPCVATQRRRLR